MDSSEDEIFRYIETDNVKAVIQILSRKPGMLDDYLFLRKAVSYLNSTKMASAIFSHCNHNIERITRMFDSESLLICALKTNRSCEIIQEILSFEKNISCNREGKSPLCFAKSLDIIKLLITNGVNANVVDRCGFSPLMTAIEEGLSNDILIELMNNTSDINVKTQHGQTVLHLALSLKLGEEIIWKICSKMDNYNVEDVYGLTPLYYGLQKHNKYYYNNETGSYKNLISGAAYSKDFILKLIRKGFDVNANVFMLAVKYCDKFNIVKELTRFIDINCLDSNQNCALHHAKDVKHIRFLLQRGASVHLKNKYGRTPLIEAILDKKSMEVIELLLSWGSTIELTYFYSDKDVKFKYFFNANIFNLCVAYGMKIDLEDPFVKDILQQNSPLSVNCFIRKFLIISNKNISIPKTDEEALELLKMKQVNIVDSLSFYDFCIKKYKSKNYCVAIKDCEFVKNNYEKVKKLFRIFRNEIIGKMKINQNIQKRMQLQKNLFKLNVSCLVQPNVSYSDDSLISNLDELNVDCLYLVSHYLSNKEINSLVAASIKE